MKFFIDVISTLSPIEYFVCLIGILFFWSLKYSKEKDLSDEESKPFPFWDWFKNWILKKNDNIFIHFMCSYFFLFMGTDNLKGFIGEYMPLPEGLDEVGVSAFLGFSGSYIAEFLKKWTP